MAEIITIIIGILGLLVAFWALKKDHYSKTNEELQHLKLQFNMTKKLMENVKEQLIKHIQLNDAKDKIMFENLTFNKYLSLLKENYQSSFNNEMCNLLNSKELTKSNILSITKSLEAQFVNLQQVENFIKSLN